MKCIIGLGNPGKKYEKTRHNVGFMAIEEQCRRHNFKLKKTKFKSLYDTSHIQQEKVMFVMPQTFMNLSGEGVKPLLDFYRIALEDIVVIYDDLDLPVGRIRLREKGGHGGHNGIRSLIDHFGTRDFKRVRVGIGRPTDTTPVIKHVLQPFTKDEQVSIDSTLTTVADACEAWLDFPFLEVMNRYNS